MGELVGTGNTSPGLTTASVLLLIWALLSYIVRVWVKLRNTESWGNDDTSISISALAIIANVAATCYAVAHGYGSPWSTLSDTTVIYKALFTSQIFYVVSIGFTKISTSFFTARFLTRDQGNTRLANGITGLCALWTLASVLIIALRRSLGSPWETLDGSARMYYRWIGIEAVGFAIDLCSLGLTFYFIWCLNMPIGKRVTVSAIFASRLAVIPIVAFRLAHLSPAQNIDLDLPSIPAEILTQAVAACAFMLASIVCLKPFLRPFHAGYITSTHPVNPTGYSPSAKNSRADAYYELSANQTNATTIDTKRVSVAHTRSLPDDGDEVALVQSVANTELALRPDRVDHRAKAFHSGRQVDQAEGDEMAISKTQAWTVSFDG